MAVDSFATSTRTLGHELRPFVQLLPQSAQVWIVDRRTRAVALVRGRPNGRRAVEQSRVRDDFFLEQAMRSGDSFASAQVLIVGDLGAAGLDRFADVARLDVLGTNLYDPKVTVVADPAVDGSIPTGKYDLCVLMARQFENPSGVAQAGWAALRSAGTLLVIDVAASEGEPADRVTLQRDFPEAEGIEVRNVSPPGTDVSGAIMRLVKS